MCSLIKVGGSTGSRGGQALHAGKTPNPSQGNLCAFLLGTIPKEELYQGGVPLSLEGLPAPVGKPRAIRWLGWDNSPSRDSCPCHSSRQRAPGGRLGALSDGGARASPSPGTQPRPRLSGYTSPAGLKAIRFFLPLFTCLKKPAWSSSAAVARLWGSGSKQDKMKALASGERASGISGWILNIPTCI